jgi:hypothetical protein
MLRRHENMPSDACFLEDGRKADVDYSCTNLISQNATWGDQAARFLCAAAQKTVDPGYSARGPGAS